MVAVAVGDSEFNAFFAAQPPNVVRFSRSANKGLFDINSARPSSDRSHDHRVVFVHVPGADGDNVWLYFAQKNCVVGVICDVSQLRLCCGAPCRIGIRDGHHFGLGNQTPDGVQTVPVITMAGVP